jgi:hypothetical protein
MVLIRGASHAATPARDHNQVQRLEKPMNRTILAATLAAAVGLSPLAADAMTHKKHHHASHTMSKGSMSKDSMSKGSMNGEPSGTTGMSNGQRTPSGDKSMAPNAMPNNSSGGTGPNARGTNGE